MKRGERRAPVAGLPLILLLLGLTAPAPAAVTNVSYWRFGENDPSAINGATTTNTVNLVGGTLGIRTNVTYTNAVSTTAASQVGSTLGLRFNSGNYGTNALFNLTNNFGLELWVRPDASNATTCLAYNGNSGANGWGLYLHAGQFKPLFGLVSLFPVSTAPATPGVWAHLALVRDNGTNTFYFNGAPVFTSTSAPNLPAGFFAVAAQPQTLTNEVFAGSMDEVRVFGFAPGAFTMGDLLGVNAAPVLDPTKSPTLTSINEDAPPPVGAVGSLVSDLVDFAAPAGQVDNVTDVDPVALLGIAITAADTANGAWFFSVNGGGSWSPLGDVSTSGARLLAANAGNRLYFHPNPEFSGTINSAITFRAWDQTSGADGTLADTSANGGTTAFSIATDTANLTVTPDNTPVFTAGSLIIPMDTAAGGQNNAMFRAYGLVYELLRQGVPVHWAINSTKAVNGNDFTINAAGNSIQNLENAAALTLPRAYRGGPFLIAASNAVVALPLIQVWQATVGDDTVVHQLVSGSIEVPVARTLSGAPRIAVLKDGNETIAFNDLDAAGILDAAGGVWTAASPDLLTEANVVGPTTSNDADGALFHTNGLTRYSFLASMHYNSTASTSEVVQEVRTWLDFGSLAQAFMQCQSVAAFENDVNGHFLTTAGLADDGVPPTSPTIRLPTDPYVQLDGTFQTDSGAVDSIGLAGGSSYRSGVMTLINDSPSPLTQRIVMLTGRMDGTNANGRVTYLGGHDYSLSLPISSNPQANGVRLFLNSIFETDVASDGADPDVALTVSAPALINSNAITYTIQYSNPGSRPVENLRLTNPLPAGASFVSASDGGTNNGGVVTWTLPPLAPGASNSVTLTVNVAADGTYTNTAQLAFSHLLVKTIRSAPVTTIRDAYPLMISGVMQSASNLVFSVTGGFSGGPYDLLTSTNVALPLTNWAVLSSGNFDSLGNVTVTNAINPATPLRFFTVRVP